MVLLLPADVRHRVSLVVLPFRGAAVFSHTAALRRAFQLRKQPIRTSDAVRFCRRSRGVLVGVDRAKGAVLNPKALFLHAISPFWALLIRPKGDRTGGGGLFYNIWRMNRGLPWGMSYAIHRYSPYRLCFCLPHLAALRLVQSVRYAATQNKLSL